MTPARIELEIGELILHGVPAHRSAAVAAALTGELTRLLTERGLPPKLAISGEWAGLDGLELSANDARTPEALGIRAAQSIYEGMLR